MTDLSRNEPGLTGNRRFERFRLAKRPTVGVRLNTELRLVDMSVMGLGLESNRPLKAGRVYAIRLPDSTGTILDGTVRWTVRSNDNQGRSSHLFRVGVDIRAAAPEKAGSILDYIAGRLVAGPYERRSILVVDDDMVCRLSAAAALTDLGNEVLAVSSGSEALRALNERHFDLVFMDCQMPSLDGFETTRWIRRGDPRYRQVPIVALTTLTSSRDRRRCFAAGMNECIAKPAEPEVLEAIVECWSESSAALLS